MENSLKAARLSKNMTQAELSEKSGVSIAIICYLETGVRNDVKLSTMRRISNALETPTEEVFASFFDKNSNEL